MTESKKMHNFIVDLMAKMTLDEKIGQLNQLNGLGTPTGPTLDNGDPNTKIELIQHGGLGAMLNVYGVENVQAFQKVAVEESRLGIPLLFGFDVIHGYHTIFPIPLAEAASWNLDLIQQTARVAAIEAAAAGLNWTFAPMVDISQDARWGRVMEGAGEDPYLACEIARARVKGFQGDDLSAVDTIAACAKHFAAYGFAEAGRDYNTVDMGQSTLHNLVLPPFQAACEAGVETIMNAFNDLNGVPANASRYLMQDILKQGWSFPGFVVSDWQSIHQMTIHGYTPDKATTAEAAFNAGSDMDMESSYYISELASLVQQGRVKESSIDESVYRILRTKYRLGLFDDPYRYCDKAREKHFLGHPQHQDIALQMAKESMVLLKNEQDLLPLPTKGLRIALIGDLAADAVSPLGNWSIQPDKLTAVTVEQALKNHCDNEIHYTPGPRLVDGEADWTRHCAINETDRQGWDEAINNAKSADIVLMVLGEHGFQSGEARSRVRLTLPGLQQELLAAVCSVNPRVVLILMNGRPLNVSWAAEHVPAILEAWQLGSLSGEAIAQVLFGKHNPCGKLPMTFPRQVGQVPIYYNHKNTGKPGPEEVIFWSHYIDEQNSPLFPFGHGLSYARFYYNAMHLDRKTITREETITVSVELENRSDMAGREVVQLYIQDCFASLVRPVKELKAFQLVDLKPHEKRTVIFTIREPQLQFYAASGKWESEAGTFRVFVGGSSQTSLEDEFLLTHN